MHYSIKMSPSSVFRGTRSTSSGSSWWWQGVALVVGSPVGEVSWAGVWVSVASLLEGRPPSTCVQPALPAGESHALHWR